MRRFFFILSFLLFLIPNYGQTGRYPLYTGYDTLTWQGMIGDGNTEMWYDYMYVSKDAADSVHVWRDISGNDKDFQQNDSTKQAIWNATTGITFDGVNDFYRVNLVSAAQPITVYIVIKQVSWTANDRAITLSESASFNVYQSTTTPNLRTTAGTASGFITTLATGNWGILTIVYDGATSILALNNADEVVTGDFGTNGCDDIAIGSNYNGTSNFGNFSFKEIIVRSIEDSAYSRLLIYNYLMYKYSL
jgi:hypothetical protein